ncbi:hypothetical protein [Aliidiomarina maris]|uniref:Uncharacterized protein n=1 Tax=Aliidiomarina maris TaxID=531312 RepID=A0A327X3F8_9GAMM|nr:hypothetical protein [Aliidiomarina maris]RAJ99172.1 hypothetical protein B0I24_103166 [Aliidiomarina maris]RUO27681.1 hypothetical protein CWE07_03420 [Aliidiomarina maris]
MLVNYFGPRPANLLNQSSDALSNGRAGMAVGEQQVNQASREIAREPLYQQQREQVLEAGRPATDETGLQIDFNRQPLTRQLINLTEGEMVFKANARSIEAAQSMFDSLLRASDSDPTRSDSSQRERSGERV